MLIFLRPVYAREQVGLIEWDGKREFIYSSVPNTRTHLLCYESLLLHLCNSTLILFWQWLWKTSTKLGTVKSIDSRALNSSQLISACFADVLLCSRLQYRYYSAICSVHSFVPEEQSWSTLIVYQWKENYVLC